GTVDGEGTSSTPRDQRFDAAFVPAEIAKRAVEHRGKRRSTDDDKENTDETPKRHENSPRCKGLFGVACCDRSPVATVRATGKLAPSLLTQIAASDLLCTVPCNSMLCCVLNSAQSDPLVARLELDHLSKS